MAGRNKYLWALGGALLAALLLSCNLRAQACTAATPEQAVQQWQQSGQRGQAAAQSAGSLPVLAAGYAVLRVVRDPVLRLGWAQVIDCAHPARPLLAIAVSNAQVVQANRRGEQPVSMHATLPGARASSSALISAAALPQIPAYIPVAVHLAAPQAAQAAQPLPPVLVRAGDHVTLWNQEPDLQLNLSAIALEYGRAGQVIHLRGTGGFASKAETIAGIVRGAGSVELLP